MSGSVMASLTLRACDLFFPCSGYPASAGYEELDAQTFAEWGVDYLKVDGCGNTTYYPTGYKRMGDALYNLSRPIVYSCSWCVSAAAGQDLLEPAKTYHLSFFFYPTTLFHVGRRIWAPMRAPSLSPQ